MAKGRRLGCGVGCGRRRQELLRRSANSKSWIHELFTHSCSHSVYPDAYFQGEDAMHDENKPLENGHEGIAQSMATVPLNNLKNLADGRERRAHLSANSRFVVRCHTKVLEVKRDEALNKVSCLLQYLKDCYVDEDVVAKAGDIEWVEVSNDVCDATTDFDNPKKTHLPFVVLARAHESIEGRKYGMSWDTLARYNEDFHSTLSKHSRLRSGSVIYLPKGDVVQEQVEGQNCEETAGMANNRSAKKRRAERTQIEFSPANQSKSLTESFEESYGSTLEDRGHTSSRPAKMRRSLASRSRSLERKYHECLLLRDKPENCATSYRVDFGQTARRGLLEEILQTDYDVDLYNNMDRQHTHKTSGKFDAMLQYSEDGLSKLSRGAFNQLSTESSMLYKIVKYKRSLEQKAFWRTQRERETKSDEETSPKSHQEPKAVDDTVFVLHRCAFAVYLALAEAEALCFLLE
eukprot:758753-Hanusia_phi.AAC.1